MHVSRFIIEAELGNCFRFQNNFEAVGLSELGGDVLKDWFAIELGLAYGRKLEQTILWSFPNSGANYNNTRGIWRERSPITFILV